MVQLEFGDESGGVIKVAAVGIATPGGMKEAHAQLAERCRQLGLSRVLLDTRRIDGSLSVIELYDLGTHMESVFRGVPLKMALLTATRVETDSDFAETTCRNRGIDLMMFDDPRSAEVWLSGAGIPATHDNDPFVQ